MKALLRGVKYFPIATKVAARMNEISSEIHVEAVKGRKSFSAPVIALPGGINIVRGVA